MVNKHLLFLQVAPALQSVVLSYSTDSLRKIGEDVTLATNAYIYNNLRSVFHHNPECTELCHYCIALTQTLSGLGFASETEKHLSWLLYELINYFAAEMKAPRWLRTAGGVKFIDGVEVKA